MRFALSPLSNLFFLFVQILFGENPTPGTRFLLSSARKKNGFENERHAGKQMRSQRGNKKQHPWAITHSNVIVSHRTHSMYWWSTILYMTDRPTLSQSHFLSRVSGISILSSLLLFADSTGPQAREEAKPTSKLQSRELPTRGGEERREKERKREQTVRHRPWRHPSDVHWRQKKQSALRLRILLTFVLSWAQ